MTMGNRVGMRVLLVCLVLVLLAGAVGAERLVPAFAWQDEIRGSEETHLRWPVAVAAGANGDVVVADAFGSRLILFRDRGASGWQPVETVQLPGTPVDLAYDGAGFVVSLRQGGGLVAVEGSPFRMRRWSLPAGVIPGAISAHPAGGVLVWDAAGGRVLHRGAGGALVMEAPVEEHVTALAAAADGGFFTASTQPAEVRRYTPSGELRESWPVPGVSPVPAWPTGISVEPGGGVVVADGHGNRLLTFDAAGSAVGFGSRRGWEAGLLLFPRGLARMPDGRIVVADQGNGRVQIFRRTEGESGE